MSGWRLAPGVLRLDRRTLAGGEPPRYLRLSPAGRAALDALLGAGAATPAAARLAARLCADGLLAPLPAPAAPAPAPAVPDGVTVVVPARARSVDRLLAAIPAGVPVVVVDDGSRPELAPAPRPGLRLHRFPVSRGAPAARNRGAALAGTPWVVFADADVLPRPGWLSGLAAALADPAVVAAAPRVRTCGGRGTAGWFERAACPLDLGALPGRVGADRRLTYLPSAVLAVRRSALLDAGGFDETLAVGEDVDLIWRLAAHGEVRYLAGTPVGHRARPTLRAAVRRRYRYGTSAAALERRHPGAVRHLRLGGPGALVAPAGMLAGAPGPALAALAGVLAVAPLGARVPARHAVLLAAWGQLHAAAGLGRYLRRPLLPVVLAAAVRWPAARPRLAAALLAGGAADAVLNGAAPPVGLARLPARLLDDLAYSAGVWTGCLRARVAGPVLPGRRR